MRPDRFLAWSLVLLIAACDVQATSTQSSATPLSLPTHTTPTIIPARTETVTAPQREPCQQWQSWPIVPAVSKKMRAVYRRGLADGNNPQAFSKIGDGEIAAEWFFTAFDLDKDYYDLGPYLHLVPVIEQFRGSFGRIGIAARSGFDTKRILDPLARDRERCELGESPLACELRLHRPAFALLSLGTNQIWQPEEFERGMRQILEILLSKNVVPILSTKGDNLEGDHHINQIITCLAQEYDVPLWNFWSAIQPLPHHGLQTDLEHLTYGGPRFDDEQAMQSAWTVRNLTALQTLDSVWRGVTAQP